MVQTAIISAAASGIGLAIARGLTADGWRVYVCDQDQAALAALAESDPALAAFACLLQQLFCLRVCFLPYL